MNVHLGDMMAIGSSRHRCQQGTITQLYWTIEDVSRYLNIKTKTLYAVVSSGNIPHYRIGKLIRFKQEDIDSWMEGNRQVRKDPSDQVKKAFRSLKRSDRDMNRIIKKTIDHTKTEGYTQSHGKPDRIEDLGKEVTDGSL
jgi:excisionase family DNA binding protein